MIGPAKAASVSVLIPTMNEEAAIAKVLEEMTKINVEEILVIDGSSDETSNIVKQMGAKLIIETRRGYGRALQTGIEQATSDIVVYIDGDYTYDANEVKSLVAPIISGEADVVLGNRLAGKHEQGSMTWLNSWGNRLISTTISKLYSIKINDTQTGFRAIRRILLQNTSYHNYDMSYVTEQLIKLISKRATIVEVPISYKRRIGKSKLSPLRDGFKILYTAILCRIR
jgi:dolichol-phosphate hexosyltransferase